MPYFSVFTPTHKPMFLHEAYQSLKDQTAKNWEWIILPNGQENIRIPQPIVDDPKVRIIEIDEKTNSIGKLKAACCDAARGEILVELDHDDMLTPRCLGEIGDARSKNPDVGFFYSDFVTLTPNMRSHVYPAESGWEMYPFEWRGNRLTAMRSFGLQPACFPYLQLMPNHVRAFTREAYDTVSGYDKELELADDYDLMCRMYIAGIKFQHIHSCLYMYRMTDDNTSKNYDELQKWKRKVSNKYTMDMVEEWCGRKDLRMANIVRNPSAQHERYESIPLERFMTEEHADFGLVRMWDLLQYVEPDNVLDVFTSTHDKLAPGGVLTTATPSTDGRAAFMPGVKSFWNENSFWAFTFKSEAKKIGNEAARFAEMRKWTMYPSKKAKKTDSAYCYVDLVALKGQHHAGYCNI